MPFTKIVPADLQGKGVIGQPPVPGLSVTEMQESVEQIVREVAIPAVNRLIDELEATSAGGNVGMEIPAGMPPETPENVQGVVQSHIENTENPHGVTAEQVGAYTKAETDEQIDQKVQAIGAADMSKAEFATSGEYGVVDKAKEAESADNAASSDDGVKLYTHSKSGTVHEFSGTGPNGRAKMTADVEAGDTFTVNGAPVTAYMGSDDAAKSMAGEEWNGKWVTFVSEDGILSFNGGGADTIPLVWENSSPSDPFPAQDVTVDLSKYTHALVCAQTRAGSFQTAHCLVKIGTNGQLNAFYSSATSQLNFYDRFFTANAGKVTFRDAYIWTLKSTGGTGVESNAQLIPQKIWGVNLP